MDTPPQWPSGDPSATTALDQLPFSLGSQDPDGSESDVSWLKASWSEVIDLHPTSSTSIGCIAKQVVGMHLCLTRTHKIAAPFPTFACACIYLMKYGLRHDVWIIPKEPCFASMLPEANVLGSFSVEKPLFTQTKNQILEAVRNMLSQHSPIEVQKMLIL